ncbi:LMBR1-like membrane protein-domain-containing protein [Clohesyomyces aquaticus]|uniref:LMBR1-like membrane protein-domain-containing protein n=1 Tax=Clohesyomyces aquaticus TaxID=1231657 RepID=A0A1Y1ZXI3_9PLEO|nr:LMBR1-like membrane protein-domain-containing protein [Clohesyomyces aquaticus]
MTTASPAGSTAFFVLSLLAISLLVLLLLRYYLPLRTTPAYVLFPVFLAIALPASIVLLVPIDLASSAGTDTSESRGIWLPDKVIYKSWRVTYWLTFALTWIILPYLGEYCDSGYREPKDRLMYAIRSNGRYQMLMLGSCVVGAIYFILTNGWHYETLKGMVMALAYAWGLVLAIYLMGHGLVAFPRSLFRYANISGRLKRLQSQAPKINDKLTEALDKLDQYECQVVQLKQRKNGISRDTQEWIEELVEMSSLPENRANVTARASTATVPAVITERYLADLTRKLKRARHAKMRFSDEWDRLIQKAVKTQAILDSKASKRLEFNTSPFSTPRAGYLSKITILTPYTRYHLHAYAIPALYYFFSVICALASACVVWSECVKSFDEPKLSLIGLTVAHLRSSSRPQIGFDGQAMAALWLCYMCICAFFSLTEVKIWGNRALVKRGTYQESATWYGLQVAKLTVPLAYNFVTFIPPMIGQETGFHRFLGRLIKLTAISEGFSTYFPIVILIPVAASLFGLYGRVKKLCGFGDLLEDEEDGDGDVFGTGSWREGRALIDREVNAASNGNALGLSQRGAGITSPPNERYTDNPPSSSAAGAGPASAARRERQRPERRPRIEEEDESGNFFSDFADRVKNTFDNVEFTRPKWMGGEEPAGSSTRGAGAASSSAGDRNDGWRSLFGGRAEEGRVRL